MVHAFRMGKRVAFITGISGQDGSYLCSFLLGKGYDVHGLLRWDSYIDPFDGLRRLEELGLVSEDITLHTGDLTDPIAMTSLIRNIQPDEIYNLAAMSHVKVSFEAPGITFDVNAKGTLNILEAVRVLRMEKKVKIYQASSSEIFGNAKPPQSENTPFEPCSPYGVAKLAGYWLAKTYRDSYDMFVANGVLFNHESPLRGQDFVTRKISHGVAAIKFGLQNEIVLGNLDSVRDWGAAQDYVEGMWMMLQHSQADDFVLASGAAHTVREFVEVAFKHVGYTIAWRGKGLDEVGYDLASGRELVRIDEDLMRPNEVNYLLGDAAKAKEELGWSSKTSFDDLVRTMVDADLNYYVREPEGWSMVG